MGRAIGSRGNMTETKPLWQCPRCGNLFVTKNMWHSCTMLELDESFARSSPEMRTLFDRLLEKVQECGPVIVIPQKTRVALQVLVRFMTVMPRKDHLVVEFWFTKERHDYRFFKVEKYANRTYGHFVRLENETDLDEDVKRWIRTSYRIGERKHLSTTP